MALNIMQPIKPVGDFPAAYASDIAMPDGSRIPDALVAALKNVNGYVASPVPPENKNVLWLDTSDNSEQSPDVASGSKDGMIIQLVNGKWTPVSIEESSIAAYIDKYINDALGGDY